MFILIFALLNYGAIFCTPIQVCDLQAKYRKSSTENADLAAQLRVYQETQEELTLELADLKDKYHEVADLLADAQNELKRSRKRTYAGIGQHKLSGMFDADSSPDPFKKDGRACFLRHQS